jgi:hypothetical protein
MDKREITILRLMGSDKFVAGRKLTLSADEYKITGPMEELKEQTGVDLTAITDLTFFWPESEK